MKIGITGSIAYGKSTVSKYLTLKGYNVYDADKISYDLTQKPNICYKLILERVGSEFPEFIIDDSGNIYRKELGRVIFNNKDKKELLESIIHPYVIKEIESVNDDVCFFEVPLLFEANLEYLFDKVVVVSTSKEKQIERLMKRNNISYEDCIIRINNQIDIKIKEEKADYVLYNNDDDIYKLYNQIDEFLKGIK